MEMCVKLVAMGLISTPHAYLGDPWNVLDGTIVIMSLLTLAFASLDLTFFKVEGKPPNPTIIEPIKYG